MKSVQREQILRLNCPGYGEESYLTIGKAKPLDQYSVIVVNPVSILHLFDKDPDAVKDIDNKLDEGLTSYTYKNDQLLQSLENDLKKRIFELVSFLEKGGLLVYFLCRPFLVQGAKTAMDNYYWLESLAPDTPTETNVRHMSAVSHGRIIEPTEHAQASDFADYFKQPGLEWNTIIREDNLTEGYIILCTAGPKKCIAAQLIAGDNDGRIVFLPAPYSPDFDRTLVDCLNLWYDKRQQNYPEPGPAKRSAEPETTPSFPQPDPNKFLAPKSEVTATASADRDASDRPQPKASYSRLNSAANPASESKTGLPPVQKFDQRISRQQPATKTGDHDVYTESALNQPLSELSRNAPPNTGSAKELLTELEGISNESEESGYVHPVDQKKQEDAPPLTLFEQLSQATDREPGRQQEKAKSSNAAQEPSSYKFGVDKKQEESSGYEYGIDEEEEEPAQPSTQPPKDVVIPTPKVEPIRKAAPQQSRGDEGLGPKKDVPNNNHDLDSTGQPKDLIKKMEEISAKTVTPDWCVDFTFPDLEELKRERSSLTDSIRQTQAKIAALESKIALLDGLKNALLAAEGEDLTIACSRVFKRLGWQPKPSEHDKSELMLSLDKPEVIARVSRSTGQAKRSDLVELSQSVITFWGETEVEPKGVMITCTWSNRPPAERTDTDYPEALIDFAEKKNLCLMTTMQLLSMYRDLELGKVAPEEIRRRITETSGRLPGFNLESAISRAAAG